MGFLELFFIAIGLAMDAFAVSICKGLDMRKINYYHATIIALFFGISQAAMPLIGWILGKQFEQYIVNVDHWIAFFLLVLIGSKMIREVIHDQEEVKNHCSSILDLKDLTILAVATSVDALAIGITFAFLQVNILPAACLIGIVTFALSWVGVIFGNRCGNRFGKKAELVGGVVLIFIGCKILLEHLHFLS